ncbi:UxaA family hydrolase [Alicyclobacillus fodiniaquatilis]|uniref:UxaA family hydrolase n=1 Tax=Alicyclobacillus fodiniaquatilis TaxID=1661150 RepID=A0ABW4JEF9_9BACL
MIDHFMGYVRPNGAVGIRNHVLVIPTSVNANHVAMRIQKLVSGTVALTHEHGGIQDAVDAVRTFRILAGVGSNPNVGAVLVVGVREEDTIPAAALSSAIASTGKPIRTIVMETCGGTIRAIEQGIQLAQELVRMIKDETRQAVGVEKLIIGSKCGGSDTTSGLACNPALGEAMDLMVQAGGSVVFSETTEIIGAEHILVQRARSEAVADKLLFCVNRFEQAVAHAGADMRGGNPSPGNIAGGLTTIEEKSLGCISKAGTATLEGVVEYGEPITGKGLFFMDSPGNDIECVSGMLALGAQLVCFTTGRGTPTGSPVAPVVKLCANPRTSQRMRDNIDIDLGDVLLGKTSIEQAGQSIYEYIISVASGDKVKAEILGHREFSINRVAVSH